jgi:hypothetical protein
MSEEPGARSEAQRSPAARTNKVKSEAMSAAEPRSDRRHDEQSGAGR